jgi:hypothetical protein
MARIRNSDGTYKLSVEHRITRLEESVKVVGDDIIELKDNHIKHLADDMAELKQQMWWGIGVAVTVLIGVIVDLGMRLIK